MTENNFGLAGVILGILSIVFAGINGFILGVIAFVFARKQMKKQANKWSRAGRILSVIGIILSIVMLIVAIWISKNPDLVSNYIK